MASTQTDTEREPRYLQLFESGELARRAEAAVAGLAECRVCPWHCGIDRLADMEMGFPEEFFSETARSEVTRALAGVRNAEQVIAWVSTGRLPHAGDMMTSRDLYQILSACEEAGLQRFVFHATHLLGAAEWTVLSRMCGTPWQDRGDFEWPADADSKVIYFSGRTAAELVP